LIVSANKAIKLAVIGRGMIGSAAARHLSKMGHVALIGPDEPADLLRHNGVFGSHYDEGRIMRRFDPEPFWVQMNCAAISRYDEISAESGVEFYREVGVLHVGPGESPDVASDWFRSGGSIDVANGLQQQILDRIRDLDFDERRVVPCMTTYGDTRLPCIGPLSDRVAVAFGCYGKSAKCSDKLGRLGGMALLGEVRSELAP
jgi:glycine/D-amino acid oxidase-like deaminating enzyme